MPSEKVLSLKSQIDRLISMYEANTSTCDIVYDILFKKNLNQIDVRNAAMYEDYIKMMRKHKTVLIDQIHADIAYKYSVSKATAQHYILKISKEKNKVNKV